MGGLDVLINNGEHSQNASFAVAGILMLVNIAVCTSAVGTAGWLLPCP